MNKIYVVYSRDRVVTHPNVTTIARHISGIFAREDIRLELLINTEALCESNNTDVLLIYALSLQYICTVSGDGEEVACANFSSHCVH